VHKITLQKSENLTGKMKYTFIESGVAENVIKYEYVKMGTDYVRVLELGTH
jgi:hypothetical protein